MNFWFRKGSVPLTPTLFKDQLYSQHCNWSDTLKIQAKFTERPAMVPLRSSYPLPLSLPPPTLPLLPNSAPITLASVHNSKHTRYASCLKPSAWKALPKDKYVANLLVLATHHHHSLLSCSTFSFLHNTSHLLTYYILYLFIMLIVYLHPIKIHKSRDLWVSLLIYPMYLEQDSINTN